MSNFRLSVSSKFNELWRYNLVVVCELCSAEGERIALHSKESFIAPVGSNLASPPSDYIDDRTISIECGEGDHLNILVYVVPHTLPTSNDIFKIRPFTLNIKVDSDGKTILNQQVDINQWSGKNLTLNRIGANDKKE